MVSLFNVIRAAAYARYSSDNQRLLNQFYKRIKRKKDQLLSGAAHYCFHERVTPVLLTVLALTPLGTKGKVVAVLISEGSLSPDDVTTIEVR